LEGKISLGRGNTWANNIGHTRNKVVCFVGFGGRDYGMVATSFALSNTLF